MNGTMPPLTLRTDAPQVVQVIYSETELRGKGEPFDPVRRVRKVHSLDGQLLLKDDPYANLSLKDVIDALRACGVSLGDLPFYSEMRERLEKKMAENRERR